MVIKSYKYRESKENTVIIYYRVVLNNQDKDCLKSLEQQIFQLKCIGASEVIITQGQELSLNILQFNDRIFPQSQFRDKITTNPEFGLLFSHKSKKNYLIAFQMDFLNDGKYKIRDLYIYNIYSPLKRQNNYPFPETEYFFLAELDTIIKKIFELPKKYKLCNNCIHYPEYQQKGYCLKYHPDTNLPC